MVWAAHGVWVTAVWVRLAAVRIWLTAVWIWLAMHLVSERVVLSISVCHGRKSSWVSHLLVDIVSNNSGNTAAAQHQYDDQHDPTITVRHARDSVILSLDIVSEVAAVAVRRRRAASAVRDASIAGRAREEVA